MAIIIRHGIYFNNTLSKVENHDAKYTKKGNLEKTYSVIIEYMGSKWRKTTTVTTSTMFEHLLRIIINLQLH